VQRFEWDDEHRLIAVHTTRISPTAKARRGKGAKGDGATSGVAHTTQSTRFDYDALGRRIAKTDAFGRTDFIWEGLRLIEERRGAHASAYLYEPASYVPLARIDASADDVVAAPAAANPAKPAAGSDSLSRSASEDEPGARIYHFHTDPSGLPEEMSDEHGHIRWRAAYRAWGNTLAERWEAVDLAGLPIAAQATDTQPLPIEQNLRYQGQYLDRDTGLHYNTFRYYDPDIGRFISPDPIGLAGGANLYAYAPNPVAWADPWGWSCTPQQMRANAQSGRAWEGTVTSTARGKYGAANVQEQVYIRPLDAQGNPVSYRVRVDNTIGAPGSSTPRIIDAKASPTAGFTPNQKTGYPLIRNYRGIIESGPSAGTRVGPTRVEIIRGPNGLPQI
jgi:RHS repeat-associated protein